jgi:hypothetical protein
MPGWGKSATLLAVLVAGAGGCTTWWSPHSLVSSDRPIREAVLVGKRVEAKVCNGNILGFIPLDSNHLMNALMDQFHELAPQAVAFQDLRFDESLTIFVLYNERCLAGSAQPVFPVPKMPPRASEDEPMPRKAPRIETPPPPDTDSGKTPEELEQELLGSPPPPTPK